MFTKFARICVILLCIATSPAHAEDTESLSYFRAYPLADRGYALIKQHEYDEATVLFERAVIFMPENVDYRAQLIHLLRQTGQMLRADEVLAEGLAQTPKNAKLLAIQRTAEPVPQPIVTVSAPPRPHVTPPAPRHYATPKANVVKYVAPPLSAAATNYNRALQLQKEGKEREAIPYLERAHASEPGNRLYTVSLAYAYRTAKENAAAIPLFAAGEKAQHDPIVSEDYAYTLKDEGKREEAAGQFRGLLKDTTDPKKFQAMRREIQQMEDNWTSVGSITYRDGLARASGIPGVQNFDDSLQYGLETVYSPDSWQRNGRRLQLYGQAFASSDSGEVNFNDNTTQGAAGIRATLVPDVEWYVYGARLFKIGNQAINDWQVRTTYSYTEGFDIDPTEESWPYLFVTPDISYLTDREELFATLETRYGQSYRQNDWVFTPHIVGAAAHRDNNFNSDDSLEVGAGLSLKYWFAETAERAPRGSAEMLLQWREPVGGDDNKSGPFLRFVLQY